MSRRQARAWLDTIVEQSRITVLHGLPRVGRSALLTAWYDDQVGVQRVRAHDIAACSAPLQVLDHLGGTDVALFVDAFRKIEASRRTKYVIAPLDLAATRRLQEELPGNVQIVDLDPLQRHEVLADELEIAQPVAAETERISSPTASNRPVFDLEQHWLRGGLPESLEADSDLASLRWRLQMIDALLLRDYSRWGISPGIRIRDFLTWVAGQNGGEFDLDNPPIGKRADARAALTVLERLGVIRQLRNYPLRSPASLARKPKVHVRDSGLLHAVLGIETIDQLRRHSLMGESWEGYAIETLIHAADRPETAQFYREPGPYGADEIDLVFDFRQRNGSLVAVECKTSPGTPPRPGFYRAMTAIGATEGFVVHSGRDAEPNLKTPRFDLASARARIVELASSRCRSPGT